MKYLGSDNSGKTVVIEAVNVDKTKGFVTGEDDDLFTPSAADSYAVEVAAESILVDAFGNPDGGSANQSKLTATINGVSVSAPAIDKVTLESADKMVIEFEEAIDSTVDLNKITVAGFEGNHNKFYTAKNLSGKAEIKASVSGKTLTLTPAKENLKFVTGTETTDVDASLTNLVSFAKEAVVAKDSKISIAGRSIASGKIEAGKVDDVKVVDNAAPVLLDAAKGTGDTKDIEFTFTENVSVEGDVAPQFRTGGAAEKSSVGETASAPVKNTLNITFTDAWFDADNSTTLLEVTVDYRTGSTIYIKDASGNKVKSTKLTGVKN